MCNFKFSKVLETKSQCYMEMLFLKKKSVKIAVRFLIFFCYGVPTVWALNG